MDVIVNEMMLLKITSCTGVTQYLVLFEFSLGKKNKGGLQKRNG